MFCGYFYGSVIYLMALCKLFFELLLSSCHSQEPFGPCFFTLMMSLRGGAWSSPNCLGSLFKRLSNEPQVVVGVRQTVFDCDPGALWSVLFGHLFTYLMYAKYMT